MSGHDTKFCYRLNSVLYYFPLEIVDCPEGMYRCGNFACLDEPWEGCDEVSSCLQTDTCGKYCSSSMSIPANHA